MFKKANVLLLVLLLSFPSISYTNAIDLDNLDDEFDTEIKTSVNSWELSVEEVTISNLSIVFNETELPADGESETSIIVGIENNEGELLSDNEIELKVEIS